MKKIVFPFLIIALLFSINVKAQDLTDEFDKTIQGVVSAPETIRQEAQRQGTIELFTYTANRRGQRMTKRARVYLPYGYDGKNKKQKYNILYLMHGGGNNTTSFLTPTKNALPLRYVLDHLIAEGKMDPIIVVTPTFYDDDENIGENRMDDATNMCREFHMELQNDLIPAVETKYNTYFQTPVQKTAEADSLAVTASRAHRAYGGFSMGCLSTWYQLAFGINAVKYYVPLSGDVWVYDDQKKKLSYAESAKWLNKQLESSPFLNDFQVFAYTGTKDLAGKAEKELIKELHQNAPVFRYDTTIASGKATPGSNIRLSMKQGGDHNYNDMNLYLYHCLPLLFKE